MHGRRFRALARVGALVGGSRPVLVGLARPDHSMGCFPDLYVSAFTYAIAGLVLRFRDDPSWKHALALGTVLGA